ncbi:MULTISPECIES: restriction endonuclease [unclassified Streptomyces]|uniref:restriction endonuclease n=1 Tax=unclassified Streptomyces TaxID=2593676 RepID=UPI0035DD2181
MNTSSLAAIPFGELDRCDLVVDAVYAGGAAGNMSDEPIGKIVPVGNQGGFRFAGSPKAGTVKLVVLYTTGRNPDWPDELDIRTGRFIYFGDNRTPGHPLHESSRNGNLFLRECFAAAHGSPQDRAAIPPVLLFEKYGDRGRTVQFRGLLAPGGDGVSADEDLVAIWRSTGKERFQNYRSVFTVLDTAAVTRAWIDEVLAGQTTGIHAPKAWTDWVEARHYRVLAAPATTIIRTPKDQEPDTDGKAILKTIKDFYDGRPTAFEACALELWRMLAPATGKAELTQPSRDGGRDAVGEYLLGPAADRVAVEFALEAKCYAPDNAVGVKDVARLISRIRDRQFGVFVTTSHFHRQVYQEVRSDRHPVVFVCGKDIVEVLRSRGYTTPEAVKRWLEKVPV